jgi:hypothetical protein
MKETWDGRWNQQPDGNCTRLMPFNQSSRQIAGESIAGNTFQCALIPVEQAIVEGFYGDIDASPYRQQLQTIFPNGVCDYRQPDQALPAELARELKTVPGQPIADQ